MRQLRLTPDVFWRLSLPEWRALLDAGGAPSLPRADLEHLMRSYPDA